MPLQLPLPLQGEVVVAAQGLLTCLRHLERACENHAGQGQGQEEAVVPVDPVVPVEPVAAHQRDWPEEKRLGWAQRAHDLLLVVEEAAAGRECLRQRAACPGCPAWAC